MTTIYVDVLIVLNIYVNYFLIKATAKITRFKLKNVRCIIASVYGSLFSLAILLPCINTFFNIIIKAFAAATIILIAFGKNKLNRSMVYITVFFIINFICAGIMYGIYSWFKPEFMHFNNSYFYIDFSLIILIASTAILYFFTCFVRRIYDQTSFENGNYKVVIKYNGNIIKLNGLADTGNSLVDFFSGLPVVVCSKSDISLLFDNQYKILEENKLPKGFRLIPCSTINNNGVIPIFEPDEIIIIDNSNKKQNVVEAMIGIALKKTEAIFNPKLIKLS